MATIQTEYDEVWSLLWTKRQGLIVQRADLEAQLSEVSNQINQLHEVLANLEPLAGFPNGETFVGMGLTDAVRWILSNTEDRVSPTEMRDALAAKGFDFSRLTTPMASIYKVLSRLAADTKRQEVLREKDEDDKVYYRWIRPAVEGEIPF